jgi:hypothetical protein
MDGDDRVLRGIHHRSEICGGLCAVIKRIGHGSTQNSIILTSVRSKIKLGVVRPLRSRKT